MSTPYPTLKKLLTTSLLPVGKTMYVWGGGWDETDTRAGTEAQSIGVNPRWIEFFCAQDETYDYTKTRYRIHDGLDCSGYIGWLLFNTFFSSASPDDASAYSHLFPGSFKYPENGFVMPAAKIAETLSECGFGTRFSSPSFHNSFSPGDICSMPGHVFLSYGTCHDHSVLLVHSSPPGVRICGTLDAFGQETRAVELATSIMKTKYPVWFQKYPSCSVPFRYLTESKIMRWNERTLCDAGCYQKCSAEEIMSMLLRDDF